MSGKTTLKLNREAVRPKQSDR